MNSNLVPKQIKSIHVVHDLLNDGSAITYQLNLTFKPDIIKVNMVSQECANIGAGNDELVKIESNISEDNPIIGNAYYNNGVSILDPELIFTSSNVPNQLKFTILNNQNNVVNTAGVTKALFIYDISFIKY